MIMIMTIILLCPRPHLSGGIALDGLRVTAVCSVLDEPQPVKTKGRGDHNNDVCFS